MATTNLSENVRVRPLDERCWVVEQLRVPGRNGRGAHLVRHPGKPSWKLLGYHGSIHQAVRSALDAELRLVGGESDIRDLAQHIDDGVERIVAAIERTTAPEEQTEPDEPPPAP